MADRIWVHRYVYLMVLPTVALYVILSYLPISGVMLAFKEFDYAKGLWGSPWIGTQVFRELFGLPNFWRAVRNSVSISLLKLFCGFPVPIVMALLLNEVRGKYFKKTVQTVTFLPNLLSWPSSAWCSRPCSRRLRVM